LLNNAPARGFENWCVAYARVVGEQTPTTAEIFYFSTSDALCECSQRLHLFVGLSEKTLRPAGEI